MEYVSSYISANLIGWLFGILSTSIGILYHKVNATAKRHKAIAEGVCALLRKEIINDYNHYKGKGFCPIYAKENVERLSGSYRNLGGNGTTESLVSELRKMPTKGRGDDKDV
jgi:hypothetical protein